MSKFELLICKECGYSAKQLHQHLKAIHKMSAAQYRDKYGKDEIMQIGFNPIKKIKNSQHSNQVLNSYKLINNNLNNIDSHYTKKELRHILLTNDYYKLFLGTGAWRTLINTNPKLYASIYKHTKIMETIFNNPKVLLAYRFKFIVEHNYNINKLKCKCGKLSYTGACRSCKLSFPSMEWFKITYPENYEDEYFKHHMNHNTKSANFGYSKVSQKLFWQIVYKMKLNHNDVYFGELNKEWMIFLTKLERNCANQNLYLLDFLYKNKNIEFDGVDPIYIKTNLYMNTRDAILNNRGYDILRVSEQDYYNDADSVINECINFLNT